MKLFRGIKNIVLGLYKGLIYWFFWASTVSMRDELFYSLDTRHKRQFDTISMVGIDNPARTNRHEADLCKVFVRLLNSESLRRARMLFGAYIERLLGMCAFCGIDSMPPTRYLRRISLYSG